MNLEEIVAPIVQWIEHLVADQKVGGSIPPGRTNFGKSLEGMGVLWQRSLGWGLF